MKLVCGADEATVTTANGGQFLFTNKAGGNAAFMGYGESCTLKVDSTQTPVKDYKLTAANTDGVISNNVLTDLRDSDAADNAGTAEIAFTAGGAGENNHSLDIGYKSAPAQTDVKLTKEVAPTTAKPGDTVVYTLTVTNESDVEATGVEVTEQLPAGVQYVSDDGAGAYVNATGIWTVGELTPKASKTIAISVLVK